MPLPVVCRRLPRVLRSVYIWQYNTSTVAEPLTVVSHSHLIFFKKNSLLTSRLFVTNSIRSVYSLSLLKLPRREFIRLLAFVVFPDSANQHRIRPVITLKKFNWFPPASGTGMNIPAPFCGFLTTSLSHSQCCHPKNYSSFIDRASYYQSIGQRQHTAPH